jgi:hypothetical protein
MLLYPLCSVTIIFACSVVRLLFGKDAVLGSDFDSGALCSTGSRQNQPLILAVEGRFGHLGDSGEYRITHEKWRTNANCGSERVCKRVFFVQKSA